MEKNTEWIASGVNDVLPLSPRAKEVAQPSTERFSIPALPGTQFVPFPALPNGSLEPVQDKRMDALIDFCPKEISTLDIPSVLYAAWAITVDSYTGTHDVVFGILLQSDTNSDLVTLCIKARREEDVGGLLHYVASQIMQSREHAYLGIERAAELDVDYVESCQLGTLLVYRKSEEIETHVAHGKPAQCPLTITCTLVGDHLHVNAAYDSRVIESPKMTRVLRQFGHVATQLAHANPTCRVTDIAHEPNFQDLKDMWTTNREVTAESDALIHEIFAEQATQRPDAVAVEGWDGVLSYSQLDNVATRLAHMLLQLGIKEHSLIPFCLKNSKWAVVAMLGILKANCAFVPIDSSSPMARRIRILELTHAEIIVTSSMSDASLWNKPVLCLTDETVSGFPLLSSLPPRMSGPGSVAYVLFTSGSTGDPKGVVVAHSAIYNSLYAIGAKIGLSKTSRTLQFTSLAFDISLFEILGTLIFGGTVCVPSEVDRLARLPEYIASAQVNTASLTPSVARLYDATMVPSLDTLILGGEAMTRADMKKWCQLRNLFNGFGPTETAVGCAMHRVHEKEKQHSLIGRLAGIPAWIVDPSDHEVLVPFGAVGELVVEGSTLALGYLDDDAKTGAAFVQDPLWLLRGCGVEFPGRHGRIYKTGDLVQYDEEGALVYIGRKDFDTQVKVRGNRIDLGEIESHLHECLPSGSEAVVDVFLPSDAPTKSDYVLAVFLRDGGADTAQISDGLTTSPSLIEVPEGVQEHLCSKLPAYMVPTVYFSVATIPKTISGKTDRKRLRGMAALFSTRNLADSSSRRTAKRAPSDETGQQLREIWANILHMEQLKIGLDDDFFALGGDSIAAIKLVREVRHAFSIGLTVADVFRFPSLVALISLVKETPSTDQVPSPAFALLSGVTNIAELLEDVAGSCGLDEQSLIEDLYACTPLQEGLLALTSKHSGTYTVQRVLELAPDVDVARFQAAWEKTARCTPIMRTRIVQHAELGLLQAVVDEKIKWMTLPSGPLDSYIRLDQETPMTLGQPLMRYALTQESSPGRHGPRHLVWTVHHALYDGWSLPLLLTRVRQAYYGEQPQRSEFAPFIRWCMQDVDRDSMVRHWQTYLEGVDESALFPPLPPSIVEPIEDQQVENEWILPEHGTTGVTRSMVLTAAWAIVASRYTSSNDVLFGTTVSGRGAPVPGIEEMVGPTVATVPTRCKVDDNKSASSFLQEVQHAAVEAILFEQTGLKRISEIDTQLRKVREIQTFLVIQPAEYDEATFEGLGKWINGPGYYRLDVSALTLECFLVKGGVRCVAYFDSHVIQAATVTRALAQFAHVSQQLCTASQSTTLGQIEVLTPSDLKDLWGWNGPLLELAEEPLPHADIQEQARIRPQAIAIRSWDAELTYTELDRYSSLLAKQLLAADVKVGDIIPLFFEPSAWVVVAMLAALKSGAAFTPIDVSQPEQRRNRVMHQLKPTVVLVSARHATTAFGPGWTALEASRQALSIGMPNGPLAQIDASSVAWVIFTSGSTGIPKGAMLQHSAVHTSHRALGAEFGLCTNTRMLQFSSFAFDACVLEIVATLMHGGCVCIPSEVQQRSISELPSTCALMGVNTMVLTPTVARLFEPSDFPSLTTLVLTGEPLVQSDLNKWNPIAYVANGYGPAECSNICTVHRIRPGDTDPNRIGNLRGVPNWVVNSLNHHQLTPVGGVGELLIEGATVGQGYLNDEEKTAAVFFTDPVWLSKISHLSARSGRRGRLYKTGDMVKLHEDGSLSYLGRKDTQIKVHGQRIELGEIEHHMLQYTEAVEVTVEAVYMSDKKKVLVAFMRLSNAISSPQFYEDPDGIINQLADNLPPFMIPTMFIQVPSIPRTASGKTDRKQLQEMGTAMASSYAPRPGKQKNRPPATDIEKHIQKLWACVLALENAGEISLDDSFIRLGGDSIAAMKLVSLAAKAGLGLTVAQIFRHTKLEDQARHVTLLTQGGPELVAPFSLLPESPDVKALRADIARAYAIEADSIEDVYPCTPLQEGLLSLSSRTSEYNAYILQHVFELPPTIDVQQLRTAWEDTVRNTDILRTRIVLHPHYGLVQVLVKEDIKWHKPADANMYIETDKQAQMGLGSPLIRYAISQDADSGQHRFIWTIHHALADGWTLDLILRKVELAYSTSHAASPVSEFKSFVKYISTRSTDEMVEYWKSSLAGYQSTTFPALPPSVRHTVEDSEVQHKQELPQNIALGALPLSTLLRAAWAIVQSNHSNTTDVVFGEVLSGRSAPVPSIETIIGPTIVSVPVRIKIDDAQTVRDMLDGLLVASTQMISHEQLGLQRISQINADCSAACSFQTLLVIQPPATAPNSQEEPTLLFSGSPDYRLATYALAIECTPASDGRSFSCHARFDSRVLSTRAVERMAAQLGHVAAQLATIAKSTCNKLVSDIVLHTPQDLRDVWNWNSTVIDPDEDLKHSMLVHQVFRQHALAAPQCMAISSWDGECSYLQLDELSDALAIVLMNLGIGAGMEQHLVPLCFERSLWVIVAMLAVLKTGAGIVPLDPAHPPSRHQTILAKICNGGWILVSPRNAQRKFGDGWTPMEVSRASAATMPIIHTFGLPKMTHQSVCWVLFTSGSTGEPKGFYLEHGAICASYRLIGETLGINRETRMLHFATYAFDLATFETIGVLISGGCICIPSDAGRLERLPQFCTEFAVDTAILTASVARLYTPADMPTLRVLGLAGEALTKQDISTWRHGVSSLFNAYGPAEAAFLAAMNRIDPDDVDPCAMRIGRLRNTPLWITAPDDCSKLAPIGSVGELLIEGFTLARGYLDPTHTAAAFIKDPEWLLQGPDGERSGRHGRLYRTGDLARYDEDGGVIYEGRKDTQVKIRGQRVELGEIEYHLGQCFPTATEVVVEVATGESDVTSVTLVAFIRSQETGGTAEEGTASVFALSSELEDELSARLPVYMIPSVFVSVSEIPKTATDKTDRRKLRGLAAIHVKRALHTYHGQPQRLPSTVMEKTLMNLWLQVLPTEEAAIGLDCNFFRLGGDSISALKLIGRAQQVGVELSIADIFQHPKLGDLAAYCADKRSAENGDDPIAGQIIIPHFSLLPKDASIPSVVDEVANACGVSAGLVEDIYPCTALQEGLMSLSTRNPGTYVSQIAIELAADVAVDLFKLAWQQTVSTLSILRSRVIQHAHLGFLQVVIQEDVAWNNSTDLDGYLKTDNSTPMGFGTPLSRYAIVRDDSGMHARFVWTVHHSIYDHVTLRLILDDVCDNYKGNKRRDFRPYTAFIRSVLNIKSTESEDFWRSTCKDEGCSIFPQRSASVLGPCEDTTLEHSYELCTTTTGVTMANVLHAAWSVVSSWHAGNHSVVFGTVFSGRTAPVPGIENIAGPTIATAPFSVTINPRETISDFLQRIQGQMVAVTPYGHFGLQHISRLSSACEHACNFQTLFVVQEGQKTLGNSLGNLLDVNSFSLRTYPLMLECSLDENGFNVKASFDSRVVDNWKMELILRQFGGVAQQLARKAEGSELIDNIETLDQQDWQLLECWNSLHSRKQWIVLSDDYKKPSPIGTTGELLIEGPDFPSKYLDDPKAKLIPLPPWLESVGPKTALLTGTLVAFDQNGSIVHAGQKSTTIWFKGQRTDVSEMERHLASLFAGTDPIVEAITIPSGGTSKSVLAVFLHCPEVAGTGDKNSKPVARWSKYSWEIEKSLSVVFPDMMPTVYVDVEAMPRFSHGGIDRSRLRALGSLFPAEKVAELRESHQKRVAVTTMQVAIRELWANVLGVREDTIHLDDDFFMSGGDSIGAIKLVAEARKKNIALAAANIFKYPKLESLAARATENEILSKSEELERPFSLIGNHVDDAGGLEDFLKSSILPCVPCAREALQDVLPCTSMQKQLFDAQGQIYYFVLDFGNAKTDARRLEHAVHGLIDRHSILRTLFVPYQTDLLQVVVSPGQLKRRFVAETLDDGKGIEAAVQHVISADKADTNIIGCPMPQFTFLSKKGETGKFQSKLIIARFSHMQFDGYSMPFVIRDLATLYATATSATHTLDSDEDRALSAASRALPPTPQFFSYIHAHYSTSSAERRKYWTRLLRGSCMTPIMIKCDTAERSYSHRRYEKRIVQPKAWHKIISSGQTSPDDVLTMAWALTLACTSQESDIVFGHTVAGRRSLRVPNGSVDEILGPCVNTLPVRVRLSSKIGQAEPDKTMKLRDLLARVQKQIRETSPFESTGLDEIVEHYAPSAWKKRPRRWTSTVVWQDFAGMQATQHVTHRANGNHEPDRKKNPENVGREDDSVAIGYLDPFAASSNVAFADLSCNVTCEIPLFDPADVAVIGQPVDGSLCFAVGYAPERVPELTAKRLADKLVAVVRCLAESPETSVQHLLKAQREN